MDKNQLTKTARAVRAKAQTLSKAMPRGTISGFQCPQCSERQVAKLPVVWLPADGGRWVAPPEAVLPDPQCRQQPELAAALLAAGVPLAMDLPESAAAAMLELTPGAAAMHPALLRSRLQRSTAHSAFSQGMCPSAASLLVDKTLIMLDFCAPIPGTKQLQFLLALFAREALCRDAAWVCRRGLSRAAAPRVLGCAGNCRRFASSASCRN